MTNKIKKIITFSSINHSSWILASLALKFNLWLNYFLIYTLLSILIIKNLENNKILHINNINSSRTSKESKFNLIINFFSLAGIPPLLGFLPKLILVQIIINYNFNFLLLVTLIASTVISLFFYLKFLLTRSLNPEKQYILTYKPSHKTIIYTTFNTSLNLIAPLLSLLIF